MRKILITFEHSSLPVHAMDFITTLKCEGFEIDFLLGSILPTIHDPFDFFINNTNIIHEIKNIDDYDMWFYDVSSWEGDKTPYLNLLHKFKGVLSCINFEDGYHFFQYRLDDYIIDKTSVFINNALYVDRCRYDRRIRNKLMLTTSYITNSQDFKNIHVPYKLKTDRAIFTGSLTGGSETGNKDEEHCRVNIPMKILNNNREIYYNIHGFDPSRKKYFESFDASFKTPMLSRSRFVELYSRSKIILSIKGNGHTVNRYFEGQSCRSLIFSTPFDKVVEFIGQGTAGKDYVEILFSGEDVVEKMDFYLKNPAESESIANNGRKVWDDFSKRDENGVLPEKVRNKIISDIRFFTGI